MNAKILKKLKNMNLFDVYPLIDVTPVRASGCYVYDIDGKEYLDLYGGHAVISIGHSHEHFNACISKQLQEIAFYSNSVKIPQQQQLADLLGRICGLPNHRLFLCNSGAEANENALKLASFRNGRKKILSFYNGFHGRTHGAVVATDNAAICAPINDRQHVEYAHINDIETVTRIISAGDISAVIIEGIQGLAGINVPDVNFLKSLHNLCDTYDVDLILDEVQSGYGRTGKFFAFQYADIQPDLVTIAKGMGNGFPVAAVLIHQKYQAKHGLLGTTFGGGYLACAAAISVLEVIEREKLMDNAKIVGDYLITQLKDIQQIKQVRGIGLMLGVEFFESATDIRQKLVERHRIFTGASSDKNVMRLLPPLSLTIKQATHFIDALKKML
jgi:acetylornithine aminotransferase